MNIEIKGIGFGNRGAELMLEAILDRLKKRDPDTVFAAAVYSGTREQHRKYGLRRIPSGGGGIRSLWRRQFRKDPDTISDADIDVLLDASGYAYGDAWRPEWVENSAKQILRYRERGKKIVLLPQAFGPFKVPSVRESSKNIFRAADLIFARDAESLKHVQDIAPGLTHISQSPDFTGILPGRLPRGFVPNDSRVCVIPNSEMLRCAPETYLAFLADCIGHVKKKGYAPSILLHEGLRDRELAGQLQETTKIPILDDPDPLCLKGIIGSCAFIIGSRYHALVSALSQGVPALGTFWSHKYRHLFEDYGCPELLIDLQSETHSTQAVLDRLCEPESRHALQIRMMEKSRIVNAKTEQMWRQIEALLAT